MKKQKLFLISFSMLAAAILISGCQYLPFRQTAAVQVPATAAVKRGTIQVAVTSSGNVSLPQTTKLGFSGAASGSQAGNTLLAELNVSMGSSVKKDQVIARLDTSAQERTITKLKGTLETAQLALQKLTQPPKPEDIAKAEAAVLSAQSSLEYAKAALVKGQSPYTDNDFAHQQALVDSAMGGVRDAQVAVAAAQDAVDVTVKKDNQAVQDAILNVIGIQAKYDKNQATDFDLQKTTHDLVAAQDLAASDFTAATNNVAKAKDAVAKANDALASAQFTLNDMTAKKNGDPLDVQQKQNSVVNAQTSLTNAQTALATLKEPPDPIDVKTQELRVQSAQWDLDDANDQLAKSTITAPFDGIIGDFTAKVGDTIQPGSFSIPIVDPTQVKVNAYVEEYDVNSVKVGMPVVVTLDAVRGQSFAGTLDAISPLSTVQSGVVRYAITIKIAGAAAQLKDGLSATASIVTGSKDNVLLVPNRALQFQGGQQQVQVLVNGQIETRVVKAGLTNDTNTEITDGLNEGDKVVIQATAATSQQRSPGGPVPGLGGSLGKPG